MKKVIASILCFSMSIGGFLGNSNAMEIKKNTVSAVLKKRSMQDICDNMQINVTEGNFDDHLTLTDDNDGGKVLYSTPYEIEWKDLCNSNNRALKSSGAYIEVQKSVFDNQRSKIQKAKFIAKCAAGLGMFGFLEAYLSQENEKLRTILVGLGIGLGVGLVKEKIHSLINLLISARSKEKNGNFLVTKKRLLIWKNKKYIEPNIVPMLDEDENMLKSIQDYKENTDKIDKQIKQIEDSIAKEEISYIPPIYGQSKLSIAESQKKSALQKKDELKQNLKKNTEKMLEKFSTNSKENMKINLDKKLKFRLVVKKEDYVSLFKLGKLKNDDSLLSFFSKNNDNEEIGNLNLTFDYFIVPEPNHKYKLTGKRNLKAPVKVNNDVEKPIEINGVDESKKSKKTKWFRFRKNKGKEVSGISKISIEKKIVNE